VVVIVIMIAIAMVATFTRFFQFVPALLRLATVLTVLSDRVL
jgi:hypothetical protein